MEGSMGVSGYSGGDMGVLITREATRRYTGTETYAGTMGGEGDKRWRRCQQGRKMWGQGRSTARLGGAWASTLPMEKEDMEMKLREQQRGMRLQGG